MTTKDTINIPDNENPKYLFNTTATKLLVAIVQGQIDATALAEEQLKQRGLNNDGLWIGFSRER